MDTADFMLSVVVTSRNDNHGGTLLRRMQTFINGFIGQCKRHSLVAELIIVEWNPPVGKPPLVEALNWPDDLGPCVVRIIQVPPEIHARMRHADALPLFQMIAKNVGIRRARGKFVLATNIDILFSDELVEFLASGQLEPKRMYRLDRYDVATEVPVDGTVEEQLAFCSKNLLRVNARAGTYRMTPDGRVCPDNQDIFGEGEFYLDTDWNPLDRWNPEGGLSRWLKKETVLTLRAPEGRPRPLRMVVGSGPALEFRPFDLEVRDDSGTLVARGRVETHLHTIDVTLPLQPGEIGRFRFCVPLPVAPDPDGWERAFRLKSCSWIPDGSFGSNMQLGGLNVADLPEPAASRIVPDGSILLGRGWIPLHYWQDEPIHWATQEAFIARPAHSGPSEPLRLLIEAGPNVDNVFDLEVLDASQTLVTTVRVVSMEPIQLDLPEHADRATFYHLRVRGEVEPDDDGGQRAFRLHSCTRGTCAPVTSRTEIAPLEMPPVWYRAARRIVRIGRKVCRRLSRTHTAVARTSDSRSVRIASAGSIIEDHSPPAAETAAVEKPKAKPKEAAAKPKPEPAPALLHTNACGDFTLMALSDWFDLRANPEWEVYSLHIDSMMCHTAHNGGVVETMLVDPMRIYHIEHAVGSGWTPEGETPLMDRITKLGIPVLTWQQLYRWGADMQALKCPMIFNGPDWGLACETLPETVLATTARAAAA